MSSNKILKRNFTKGRKKLRIKEQFSEVVRLHSVIDPPEKPYESKYKARKILEEIIGQIDANDNDALLGSLYTTMGVIDVDVEELSTGKEFKLTENS